MNKLLKFLWLIPLLTLSQCSSDVADGDFAYSSVNADRLSATCLTSKTGLSLLATVAYEPVVKEFLDTNCANCHGDRSIRNLDFRSYDAAQSTLAAKDLTFEKIVSQIQSDHKNQYDGGDKTMFLTWQSDGFLETLPSGSGEDSQTDSNESDNGSNDELNSTILDNVNQINNSDQQNNAANSSTGPSQDTTNSSNQEGCP